MSWAPQGNGWTGAPAAQDELALRLGQLALRAGAGSDPSHLVSMGMHPPALASEHLLSQARQRQLYQGPRVHGLPVQPGVNMPNMKPARLPLGVRGAPTFVPVLNAGLMHAAQLGAGRAGSSTAGPVLGTDRYKGNAAQGIGSQSSQQHHQAALLALVQNQLAAAHMQQQGYAGTIPAVPSVVQQAPIYGHNRATAAANQANMIAAATATAAAQVASMQNAATLAARTSVGTSHAKQQMLGADLSGMGQQHWGANGLSQGVAHGTGGLQNGLQGSWGSQLSLAGSNGVQLQQLAPGMGLGHRVGSALNNSVAELRLGNLGHLGVLGQGITSQACPMTDGSLQTAGLYAPSIMASAPILPILGEDLAKPNVQHNQGVLPGIAPGALRLMQSAPSALQSAASLDSSSVKSCETGMTVGSTASGSPKLTLASDAQKLKAADSAATSVPMAALDVSTLTQAQVNALVSARAQTEEIQLLAAQFGLLGRPAGGSSAVSGGTAVGVATSSAAATAVGGGPHRERDMSTLKTLGQMLARTGNTVESAVQTGLLGGCNAEDVKVVWEAYAAELVGMKQAASLGSAWSRELPKGRHLGTSVLPTSNLVEQPTASENLGGVIGDKREAPSQVADQSVALQSSAAAGSTTVVTPSLSSAPSDTVNQTAQEEEEEPNWDEVFENEEKLVPSHVISAVNDSAADILAAGLKVPSEGAFNAFSYGFFGGAGDCGGELLEDSLEDLQKPTGGDSDFDSGKQNPAVWETLAQEGEELHSELVDDSLTVDAEKERKHGLTIMGCDETRFQKMEDAALAK